MTCKYCNYLAKWGKFARKKDVNTSNKKMVISSDVQNYIEFCSTLGLKQLIKVPTRITSNTSILIDYILTSRSEKLVQTSIVETSLSDHQLIFSTRKIKSAKPTTIILHFAVKKISQLKFWRKHWVS